MIQFYDCSYDPGGMGFQSFTWDFGDGTTSTDYGPAHMYGKDGDFTVQHGVTTYDARSASTSQVIQVRTHDVSITKLLAPRTASVGQKKAITLSIKNTRYPERVRIELYRSNSTGWYDFVGSVTKSVPVQKGNRTTQFSFNYTFTQQDAQMGKVTFKAVVMIEGARDAFPFDNEITTMPPTVLKKSGVSYP
jgi:PKD repeat protein